MGAWIETSQYVDFDAKEQSHPMWVRGLKQPFLSLSNSVFRVAPHVGAWIETVFDLLTMPAGNVAPHVGAWIETLKVKHPLS